MNFLVSQVTSSIVNSRSPVLFVPYSNFLLSILNVLHENGFLKEVSVDQTSSNIKKIKVEKSSNNSGFFIKNIRVISKPGRRFYVSHHELVSMCRRDLFKFYLISTSFGVLPIKDCISKNLGGEIILEITIR